MIIYSFIAKGISILADFSTQENDMPETVSIKVLGKIEQTRNKKTFSIREYNITVFSIKEFTYGVFYGGKMGKEVIFEYISNQTDF